MQSISNHNSAHIASLAFHSLYGAAVQRNNFAQEIGLQGLGGGAHKAYNQSFNLDQDKGGIAYALPAMHMDSTQGSFRASHPEHLALQGERCFFTVHDENGEVHLTRCGAISRNSQGEMLVLGKYPLLDTEGQPLLIPINATSLYITADGEMRDTILGSLGKIGIVTTDVHALEVTPLGLFRANAALEAAQNFKVTQGFLEERPLYLPEFAMEMMEEGGKFSLTNTIWKHYAKALKSLSDPS